MVKILMVLTSHDELGNTDRKTSFWLEELAAPYYAFKDAGAEASTTSAARSQEQRAGLPDRPDPSL